MEVGLGPVHIVLDGDTAPLAKTGQSPPQIFGPSLLWPNGWMHQDVTWYGGRPHVGLRDIVFDVEYAATSSKRAHPLPPSFWPMSIVAKWLDG